jgi:hypothetical protein
VVRLHLGRASHEWWALEVSQQNLREIFGREWRKRRAKERAKDKEIGEIIDAMGVSGRVDSVLG